VNFPLEPNTVSSSRWDQPLFDRLCGGLASALLALKEAPAIVYQRNSPVARKVEHPTNSHRTSSSLLSLQKLEGPCAVSRVIQESMSLKYEPASVPQHISVKWLYLNPFVGIALSAAVPRHAD